MPFAKSEYLERIRRTKERMQARGIDTLLVVDPANMNYLTGYDGWSFYTPQTIILGQELAEPICITRLMDANGAKLTTFLDHANILGFPDHYVQSTERHPMDYIAGIVSDRGLGKGTIGLEMDAYYFSPAGYEALKRGLPNARLVDSGQLVAWVRAVKSAVEITYMDQAARIIEKTMQAAIDAIRPGVRQCDVVAKIYATQIIGTAEYVRSDSGGEHTMSLRPGDKTVLQPNMTLHVIPGIWMDDWGIEMSECIHITERGARPFCTFPRKLFVRD
jgi:Xaa-Pro aminopeptidase